MSARPLFLAEAVERAQRARAGGHGAAGHGSAGHNPSRLSERSRPLLPDQPRNPPIIEWNEPFGIVMIEAMACGTPVIASEVGGLGYLVQNGETGYTVPDSDPQALCEKLSILLNDAALRETMGLRAASYALDYAWDKIAKQIVDVYEDLLKSTATRKNSG